MSYASGTKVSTTRTIDEIKRMLRRAGATDFYHYDGADSVIAKFRMKNFLVKVSAVMPHAPESNNQYLQRAYAQRQREQYRALALTIKSVLVCSTNKVLIEGAAIPAMDTDSRQVAMFTKSEPPKNVCTTCGYELCACPAPSGAI